MVGRKKIRDTAPRPGASRKYVQVTPLGSLAGGAEWRHIDEVEPLKEAVPRYFRMYEAREEKDVALLRVLVRAVERQHETVADKVAEEALWAQFVPQLSLAQARDAVADVSRM